MKILVFNGSPKKEKSDTMHITRAFLDGMKEAAPQEIHTVDVVDRHIEFCRGCFACMYNGGRCGTILTVPESPMFSAPEAAVVTVPRLELVKQAGRQYAQTGDIDAPLLAEIGSPMIPEEMYAKIVNGNV